MGHSGRVEHVAKGQPETPVDSPPDGELAAAGTGALTVSLFDDGDLPWRPVSGRLATARSVVLTVAVGVPALLLVSALALSRWMLLPVIAAVAIWLIGLWVIRRQVAAISYVELAEELVIRKGRLARSMVSVPYGRLQYIDVQSGPLARRLGLAELELHTASPLTGGTIPGLPIQEAEALRHRLAARGESQRAGL
jgi:membrane protein YdbS with pleckstrin-like domain